MRVKGLFQKEEQILLNYEKKLTKDFFSDEKAAKAYESLLKEFRRLCFKVMRLASISDRVQADLNQLNSRLNEANEEINKKNQLLEQYSRRLSRDLEDTEEKYRSIFENAMEGMFQCTPDGFYLAVNTAMANMLGYESKKEMLESLEDMTARHFSDPEQSAVFRREIEARGVVRAFEMTMRRRDGVEFFVSVNARLVVNAADGSVMYEGSVVNITERKEKERAQLEREAALAANQAKSAFLASMSHEIRTPMNAVIGMADLLVQSSRLNPKQREYAEIIHNSANDLLGILNDILDFSKIEAGKLVFEDIPFDLIDTVESVSDMFLEQLVAKPIEFFVEIGPGVPRQVIADPLRLRQVLINLLSNAFKFTEAGEIRLEVSLVTRNQTRAEIMFSVSDTGIGISEDAQRRIFHAFSQADSTTSRKFGGTGLGLAICKKICTLMDGNIWVESKPGQGSRFSFTAKLAQGKAPQIHGLPLKGRSVLLVTAISRQALVLMRSLNEFGVQVQTAKTAAEARERLQVLEAGAQDYVILMEASLPDATGLDFIAQLTESGVTKRGAILLMGPYGDENLENRALLAGAKGYLFKPIKTTRLLNGILEALGLLDDFEVQKSRASGISLAGVRLLLVEDNLINQLVATEILNQEQIDVVCAANGQEAIKMLAEQSYDAVLMDIQMPVMNGLEATKAIRKMKDLKKLPIIAMTADAMQDNREQCLEVGMNDFVTKPINRQELLLTLSRYVTPVSAGSASDQGAPCEQGHSSPQKD